MNELKNDTRQFEIDPSYTPFKETTEKCFPLFKDLTHQLNTQIPVTNEEVKRGINKLSHNKYQDPAGFKAKVFIFLEQN